NLNDDDWLWGGELSEIEFTLTHGIRWEGSDETRFNMMPAYGEFMNAGDLDALANHALSLSGKANISAKGAELFEQNCAACHMADGSGNQELGAPALNDAIWLYGDDLAQVRQQIAQPRHGVMPGWSDKLDEVTIRMLAAYIHSRGGGEETTSGELIEAEPAQAAAAEVEGDERG
ncbi:MAG: c-type cytochrome, partial [Pseudomonadota bacterium]